jgi:hypothetical protein
VLVPANILPSCPAAVLGQQATIVAAGSTGSGTLYFLPGSSHAATCRKVAGRYLWVSQ